MIKEGKKAAKAYIGVPFSAPKDEITKAMYEAAFAHRLLRSLGLTLTVSCKTRHARLYYDYLSNSAIKFGGWCLEIGLSTLNAPPGAKG